MLNKPKGFSGKFGGFPLIYNTGWKLENTRNTAEGCGVTVLFFGQYENRTFYLLVDYNANNATMQWCEGEPAGYMSQSITSISNMRTMHSSKPIRDPIPQNLR